VAGFRPDSESIGTAVLGAGPAGLTGAYVLARRGERGAVFEADDVVGGIARTVEFDGYRCDLGGHRFFTKLAPVERLWQEALGEELLTRPRLSRIYYQGTFFDYPLTAKDVVARLGFAESTRSALSYLWGRARRPRNPDTFEEWVTSRFGRRLYEAFFRSYTEKVWGIPGSEIRAEWAVQRIQNFSLFKAMLTILGARRQHVTTLIEEFRYPRLGPGQMWEEFRWLVEEGDVPVCLNTRCVGVRHDGRRVREIVVESADGRATHVVDGVLSSIPLSELVLAFDPEVPDDVRRAARRLRYRDLVVVALVTEQDCPFPDNWIYLHDPGTRAGRVQNFGAWSPSMVQPGTTCLGVEYFCFEGDDIWGLEEGSAIELARDELARIGLVDPSQITGGRRIRVPKAYPMYDGTYRASVATIRRYLDRFQNLQPCGRNGLHRYNNQDHSMWTAILGTLNLLDGAGHDVWSVNTEATYLEEGEVAGELLELELAPRPLRRAS
jgi:protoporphyrinogen oxidase